MTGGLAAVSARIREIENRIASFTPAARRPAGGPEPASSVNVRAPSVPGRVAPNPAFAKILESEIARGAAFLPGSERASDGSTGLLGSGLDGLLGLSSGGGTLTQIASLLQPGSQSLGGLSGLGGLGALNPAAYPRVRDSMTAQSPTFKYNPFRDLEVTSGFGQRVLGGRAQQHTGVDFAVREGTPLPALGSGTVVSVGEDSTFGRNVVFRLQSGEDIRYAHMTDQVPFLVREGQRVLTGDIIGVSGNTGESTGPHVHVSVQIAGSYADPLPYLAALP